MDNFEKELANLTVEEREIVVDRLKSELSHEQSQLVRDVIMQRANNIPYATIIISAIEKYIGKSVQELADMFDLSYQSKSLNRNIISCILDIEGLNEGHDRFSKEMIKIKSVTLNDKNKFNNGMSLNQFNFETIVEEEWETSSLRLTFKKNIFLFVIFKEESPTNIILDKCIGWTIDNDILDTKIKEVWDIVKENLVSGKVISFIDINKRMKTTFPSTTFNGVCFVAAHAHSKKDTSKLPVADKLTGITDLTKHSFWLTKDYLYDILGISNDISLKNQELDSIRVPIGFDTSEHSVTIDEDVNKVVDTHVTEEISFAFEEQNSDDESELTDDIDLSEEIMLEFEETDSIDESELIEDAPLFEEITFEFDGTNVSYEAELIDDAPVSEEIAFESDDTNVSYEAELIEDTPVSEEITFEFDDADADYETEINEDAPISEEIEITFDTLNDFDIMNDTVLEMPKEDSIDDLIASLRKKPVEKPTEAIIEDSIEITLNNTFEDSEFDDDDDDDEIEFEDINFDDDIDLDDIISSSAEDDIDDIEVPEIPDFTEPVEAPKPPTRKIVTESSDPIIDRFSGSESVATLTARLESNLRKLEAEYSTGLGTLSASGKYSLRGRIEKRIASEMDGGMLTYEHIEVVDPKVKKKKEKQLKKAEKKHKKLK